MENKHNYRRSVPKILLRNAVEHMLFAFVTAKKDDGYTLNQAILAFINRFGVSINMETAKSAYDRMQNELKGMQRFDDDERN